VAEAVNELGVGVVGDVSGVVGKRVGKPDVVAVEVGQPLCPRSLDPGVPGRSLPGVGLMHRDDAVVGSRVLVDDLPASVGRAVVHDDQLEVSPCLGEHRINGPADVSDVVVYGHDHAEHRGIGRPGWPGCLSLRALAPTVHGGPKPLIFCGSRHVPALVCHSSTSSCHGTGTAALGRRQLACQTQQRSQAKESA